MKTTISTSTKRILFYVDLTFCLVFLPLLTILIPIDKLFAYHAKFLCALVIYLFGIYIVNRIFNIPALLLNRRYLKAFLVVSVMVVATYFLSQFPFPESSFPLTEQQIKIRGVLRQQMIWFLFLIVIGFCFSFGLLSELFIQKTRRQEIEAEKNKAEIALYKAQINPHFLFNTLNTLYGLALAQSENLESAFIKFSDILKYMYANANRDTITTGEEIDYITQYIDLQKLRINEHTKIEFTHFVDNHNCSIPPMVLITFVENAFKYGISSISESKIEINLRLEDGVLNFQTTNNIVSSPKSERDSIGIENCRKRLDLLYGDNYNLNTYRLGEKFKVDLTIKLDQK